MYATLHDPLGKEIMVNPDQVLYVSQQLGNSMLHFAGEYKLIVRGTPRQVGVTLHNAQVLTRGT